MSHIAEIEVEIRDLAAVKALCKERGWQFMEGQKTCRFWEGATHPCDHAIKIPGANYDAEVGLVYRPAGVYEKGPAKGKSRAASYSLAYDGLCFPDGTMDKNKYATATGGCFLQGYGICKTELEAKRRGLHVKRVQGKAGAMKLVLTGGAL